MWLRNCWMLNISLLLWLCLIWPTLILVLANYVQVISILIVILYFDELMYNSLINKKWCHIYNTYWSFYYICLDKFRRKSINIFNQKHYLFSNFENKMHTIDTCWWAVEIKCWQCSKMFTEKQLQQRQKWLPPSKYS